MTTIYLLCEQPRNYEPGCFEVKEWHASKDIAEAKADKLNRSDFESREAHAKAERRAGRQAARPYFWHAYFVIEVPEAQ